MHGNRIDTHDHTFSEEKGVFWTGIQNNIVHSVREELKTPFYLICTWLQMYLQLFIKETTVLVLYWKWMHSESHGLDSTERQQVFFPVVECVLKLMGRKQDK